MTIESSAWPSVLSVTLPSTPIHLIQWPELERTAAQGGCEYGRIIADLFPEDASHCFAAVLPKYVEVTGWKPLTYSRLLDGFRGVKAVSSPPDHMSEEQLRDIAQGVCKTLGMCAIRRCINANPFTLIFVHQVLDLAGLSKAHRVGGAVCC